MRPLQNAAGSETFGIPSNANEFTSEINPPLAMQIPVTIEVL